VRGESSVGFFVRPVEVFVLLLVQPFLKEEHSKLNVGARASRIVLGCGYHFLGALFRSLPIA
jgi:hypothetical protein